MAAQADPESFARVVIGELDNGMKNKWRMHYG